MMQHTRAADCYVRCSRLLFLQHTGVVAAHYFLKKSSVQPHTQTSVVRCMSGMRCKCSI